jgi:hypothetical protein
VQPLPPTPFRASIPWVSEGSRVEEYPYLYSDVTKEGASMPADRKKRVRLPPDVLMTITRDVGTDDRWMIRPAALCQDLSFCLPSESE